MAEPSSSVDQATSAPETPPVQVSIGSTAELAPTTTEATAVAAGAALQATAHNEESIAEIQEQVSTIEDETEKQVKEFEAWKTATSEAILSNSNRMAELSEQVTTMGAGILALSEQVQKMLQLIPQPQSQASAADTGTIASANGATQNAPLNPEAETATQPAPEKAPENRRRWL